MTTELQQLQQLYILADETRLHYFIQQSKNCPDDKEIASRRAATIATNMAALTASIQHLIDQGVLS